MTPGQMRAATGRHAHLTARHSVSRDDTKILLVISIGRREDAMSRTRLIGSPALSTRTGESGCQPERSQRLNFHPHDCG